jgi:GAF domain-containing protein
VSGPLSRAKAQTRRDRRRQSARANAYRARLVAAERRFEDLLNVLIPVGVALIGEDDFNRLLERILLEARALCRADGGTLYVRTPDDQLQFAMMRTDSLGLAVGGTTGQAVGFAPLPLYDATTGQPNERNVATYSATRGQTVNIADAYTAEGFDFSGTRAFDQRTGYRSASLLTVPLRDRRGQVIGVLQLLNAQDRQSGAVVPFDPGRQRVVEGLALLAGTALETYLREQSLREEIQQLRVEVDEARKTREVAELAGAVDFRRLRERGIMHRTQRTRLDR